MSTDRRLYQLAPLDSSGVFLGLSVLQASVIGAGLTTAVAAITIGAPLMIAMALVVAGAIVGLVRVRGQALAEWIPVLARWRLTRHRGADRWRSPLPLFPSDPDASPLPPALGGLETLAVPWRSGTDLGAVRDRQRGTLTAVVPVAGGQFITQPAEEQDRLLSAWGDLLATFATAHGAVTHLAWSDLARPSGLIEHRAWLTRQPAHHQHPAAADSYGQLLRTATSNATTHETVLTLTVAASRLHRRHRHSTDGLPRALTGAVESLLRALTNAGLAAGDPLSRGQLHHLIRTRTDPFHQASGPHQLSLADQAGHLAARSAAPTAMELDWSQLRTDGTWQRTWWIATWPRLPVPAGWMEPFLSAGGVTRTVTVVLAPVPAHQSRRRIERDLVKLESDAATRHDKGRRVDARHQRATRALLEREEELVAGYAEMAYLGLVTVTAPDLTTLDDHGEIIEQQAREHGMDLRLLHGRQDLAWAAALPVGLAPAATLAS